MERLLLRIVAAHLVFLPWAIGGTEAWAQWISLVLALGGFVLALLPRQYTGVQTGEAAFRLVTYPKLLRFPIFWLGAALLALIMIHALHPAWEYQPDGKWFSMREIAHAGWLPAGVRVPFSLGGPWRMLLIHASVWLTVCAIWVGITRRRALQALLIAIAVNGIAIALLGLAQRVTGTSKMFWVIELPRDAQLYSSFRFNNDAAGYLAGAIPAVLALAAWYYVRGVRRMEKSNPGGIFLFCVAIMAISVIASLARGATLAVLAYLLLAGIGFICHQLFHAPKATRKPVIAIALLVVFAASMKPALESIDSNAAWIRMKAGFANGGDYSFRSRLVATKASFEMWQDNWVTGAGSGSFAFLFPPYQENHPEILYGMWDGSRSWWKHANNDWMEIPLELGVPGLLIIGLSFGWYLLMLGKARAWDNPIGLTIVPGLLLLALYSYWDSPFQNPATLLLWCSLWTVAARWTEFENRGAVCR